MVEGPERECDKVNQQDKAITLEFVTERMKKIPNWKAPGPVGVQGYWLKKLTSLHDRIADQMSELVNNRVPLPVSMITGRTVLFQKDPQKGNVVEHYRPISCLPLLWKLMTGIISDYVYQMFLESDILRVEQKGCRKKSRGTKDQLLIDKMILNGSKRRKKNLAMAWVGYKKAYDMVPNSWIVECLQLDRYHRM